MEIDHERLVIVAALHGEKFIGHTPGYIKCTPQEYMEKAAQQNKPVELYNVRSLLSQPQAKKLPSGETVIAGFVALMPFEFMPGPAEKIWVRASTWHFPAENPRSKEKIITLLAQAEDSERKVSALEAGIDVPHIGDLIGKR